MNVNQLSEIDLDSVCGAQYNEFTVKDAMIKSFSPDSEQSIQSARKTYNRLGFVRLNIGERLSLRRN